MNRAVFTVGNTIYEVVEYPSFEKHNGYYKKNIIVNYKNLNSEQDKRQVVNSLAGESIYRPFWFSYNYIFNRYVVYVSYF